MTDKPQPFRRRRLFPRTIGECVERAIAPALKERKGMDARLIRDWEKIAGHGIAAHATPKALKFPRGATLGGTLVLEVEAGYALEIQHRSTEIVERLASYFGYRAVERITLEPRALPLTPVRKRVARTQPAMAVIADIEDAELKAALESLRDAMLKSDA